MALQLDSLFLEWGSYHVEQPRPRGIPNPKYLCYRNSALITLLHAPVVVNWFFFHDEHLDRPVTDKQGCMDCLLCFFRVFFEEYWLHRESHLAMWNHLHCLSSTINYKIRHDNEDPEDQDLEDQDLKYQDLENDQQDVMEYLTYVLNLLKEQTPGSNLPYAVQDIFQHEMVYQTTCEGCGDIKTYNDNNPDTGLFLGASIDKQQRTIEDAIDRFLYRPEYAFDWTCEHEHCTRKRKNTSARRSAIRDAPEILLVQLNRFDPNGGVPGKLKTPVIFKEILDITENQERRRGKDPVRKLRYQLFAVIYHRGETTSSGHYYTYARGPTGKWSSINDHIVEEIKFADVTKAQSKDDCVYVLAYQRESTVDKSAMYEAADCQLQTREDTAQTAAQVASGKGSVDVRAQITLGDRALIGDLGGWLTLPDSRPLNDLKGGKRVQPTTVHIAITEGESNFGGIIKGSLKPGQGVPLNQRPHPSATALETTHSQFVLSKPAFSQEPAAQEIDPQIKGPKPHGTKPPIPAALEKRKRDQVEESQDPQESGERAPSTKQQKAGHKQKANKGGKSGSKNKNNHNQKTNEGNEGNGQLGHDDKARVPTKPQQKLILKVKNPDVQAREYQEEVDQGSTGGYLTGDLVQPPRQPPLQPRAQVKPQRPQKPPPREGARKNPPRTGKKCTR